MSECEESRGNTHGNAPGNALDALAEQHAIAVYRLRCEITRLQAELLTMATAQPPIEALKP